jgi:deoxyribodipyrimidine photolyase-related protein
MTIGVWVLGDQLWMGQSALQSCQVQQTPVILIESWDYVRQRPYHLQKLVLVWSAMRHFAEELRQNQWAVTYAQAEDFRTPLLDWIEQYQITELRVMQPIDRPFAKLIQQLDLPCPITLTENNRLIWSDRAFQEWASGRKRLVMEDFYREGRRRFGVLMATSQ